MFPFLFLSNANAIRLEYNLNITTRKHFLSCFITVKLADYMNKMSPSMTLTSLSSSIYLSAAMKQKWFLMLQPVSAEEKENAQLVI